MAKRIRIKKKTMQEASLIESDRGEYGKQRGGDSKTRKSKDGPSATMNYEHHFGYKSHTLVIELKIVEKLWATPANARDSRTDLSVQGIICYKDKGYFGSERKGHQRYSGSCCQEPQASSEEYMQEPPHIKRPFSGGTSIYVHQEDVPFWSCDGNNCAESQSEDILHRNVLQSHEGKIS